eukprot:TRINITY_DN16891_c0_g1_i1.p1 TRINITY_DN16891_c0_g1~~TRINITY_DN16891_c0_g1_i1.p1  ORF type:complete len:626 (+),score=157.10 TRINITY_DN16891_c0_g1_i1:354-2231(+)
MHVLTVLCAPKGQSPPAVPTAFEATPEMPFRNQYTQRISLDPDLKLVFLGDMIDGGHQSSQVLLLLLALKLTYPDRVFLLRGRRESKTEWSPRAHSVLLQDELARRYENLPGADPEELYTQCSRVFRSLPIAAVVNEEYFCVSGGIGPGSLSDDPTSLVRQEDTMKQSTLCDLVWSDPMDDEDEDLQSNALFLHNYEKGIGYNYSFNAVMNFITEKKYRCIVRSVSFPDSRDVAPQVTRQSHNSSGRPWHYQYSYYDPGYRLYRRNPLTNFPTVIGLFSAPRFLNENENRGAVMFIEGDKMNLRQFTAACRPFALPKMKNALEWSIPSVCSQAASVAEALWNVCSAADDDPHRRALSHLRNDAHYDKQRAQLLGFQKLCKMVKKRERAQGNAMMMNGLSGLVTSDEPVIRPLAARPPVFYSLDRFERLRPLQEHFKAIREECAAVWKTRKVLDLHRPAGAWVGGNSNEFINHYMQQEGWIPSYQTKTGRNYSWLNYGLMHNGSLLARNAATCPKTTELIQQINQIAMVRVCGFSAMLPHSEIKPHRDQAGVLDNALAFHLGLIVPSKQDCYLVVDNQVANHEEGEVIIFDSTYTHSATNGSDEDRIVLYIDFQLCSTDPIQKYLL